ncbi:MAG: carboxylating nicotinate-nucleotide diphosphorylase [Bacteroidales bacterium]|jgi:nicotinate-nucleotide pyrophosphorylase (carboxylating)|nr:carboxylating nicotinate-nucleotide diphosphorylase [Bacteroidales bacterium]
MIPKEYLNKIIELAYLEDVGSGDYSSLATIDQEIKGQAKLLVKEKGIIAGIEIAKQVCDYFSPNFELEIFKKDGDEVEVGDIVFVVSGFQIDILKAERTILNFMQRMSGIATETYKYVKRCEGLKTKILDTRKTTPGLRLIEKEAVRIGGGTNHRIGLFDMMMLKDNHVDFCGSIGQAIFKANDYIRKNNLNIKIEIETRNFDEIKQVLEIGKVHRIMFDNFSIEETKKAVSMVNYVFETESSGGITYENIREYAECGVDFISVGALTHHIKSLDLSLKKI